MNYADPDVLMKHIAGVEIVKRGIWILVYNLLLKSFFSTSTLNPSFFDQLSELPEESPRRLFAEYMISLHCKTTVLPCPTPFIGMSFME